jgi:hypothetical protein
LYPFTGVQTPSQVNDPDIIDPIIDRIIDPTVKAPVKDGQMFSL